MPKQASNVFPILLAIFLLIACSDDEHAVMQCELGQGLDLDTEGVPIFGEESAPIDVTLFVDFQCPPSGNMALHVLALLNQLEDEDKSDYLKLHIHHFASPSHNRARAAAIAAAAAHRQGDDAFYRLFPHLFKNGVDLSDEDILQYAELAQLDLVQFQSDLNDSSLDDFVDQEFELAVEIGLDATPGVVICGTIVEPDPEAVVSNLEYLVEGEL